MKDYTSKSITSDQVGPHQDLLKVLKKYHIDNYQRPPAPFSLELMQELLPLMEKHQKIILDTGCGTGESSFNLAKENPDCFIIGIDKSSSRIDRHSDFKKSEAVSNFVIARGELLDLWPLIYQHSLKSDWKIVKQCLLYPNPWPKGKALKRRWQGSPIMPFICAIGGEIDVRSNWRIYLEEMAMAIEFYTGKKFEIKKWHPKVPFTLFEKKYLLSGQDLYRLVGTIDDIQSL
jgi:tRNA (guanine-N7-)-methyltransferase